ncbi:SRPBCC family protein [Novosphingobium sp. AP12]|uniref:SRPBCC family protein n=1 Tax=Novosphingobium sp. AP12 TaxID=1144305 RepID=UPI000271E222|nr:SRPBCC family protein [Novosphingobium sp. AP12]EJL33407.1 Polyketide cyclase / dehydrase and lipid transport [Novosphingobium sp. AP12]
MAKALSTIDLPIPAEDVWSLIGGFDSLPDWLPYIPKSELHEGGRVRHLANPDGGVIVERLMAFDEKGRSYSYHILQSPFPQKDYLSTLTVKEGDGGNGSRVEWSGEFTPVGVSEEEVSKLFQGIYDDGLKALKAHYEKP